MAALLAELGPGRYRYGSQWNIESPRQRGFRNLRGVAVEAIEELVLQGVDFARWGSWDDYFRQVSNNARRSAKRASKRYSVLSVRVRQGLATLLDTPALTGLHHGMASRKRITASLARILSRFLLRTVAMRKYAITAVAIADGQALAAFSGIEFGKNMYYLTGGSEADNGGAAWHLMLMVIRRAYDRTHGSGKFLMGIAQNGGPGWEGLARSREQCRATDFPTSIVTFTYGVDCA